MEVSLDGWPPADDGRPESVNKMSGIRSSQPPSPSNGDRGEDAKAPRSSLPPPAQPIPGFVELTIHESGVKRQFKVSLIMGIQQGPAGSRARTFIGYGDGVNEVDEPYHRVCQLVAEAIEAASQPPRGY